MSRQTGIRVGIGAAAAIVVAVVVILVVALSGGKSSSTPPKPTVGPSRAAINGSGGATSGTTAAGTPAVGHFSKHLGALAPALVKKLKSRLVENEGFTEHLNTLHVTSTNVNSRPVSITAPIRSSNSAPGRVRNAVRPHVTGNTADVSVGLDATVADTSSTLATSAKEPSVAVNGNTIFETGNWYSVRSLDGGRSWQDFDPYRTFGNDFCCDQVVLFDQPHQLYYWLLQFSDANDRGYLDLAVSPASQAFDHYCVYKFTAQSFGLPATGSVDYNDLATTKQFLYINSNVYPNDNARGQASVIRIPISQLNSCGHISTQFFSDPTVMSLKPVQGAQDAMFFGTGYVRNAQVGRSYRIYRWADSSSRYTWYTKKVDAFNFETPHVGSSGDGNCASADGTVTNWCERTQGQTNGAVVDGNRLVFAFNAAQLGSSRPYPYSRILFFDAGNMQYLGSEDLFSTHVAILYPTMAVNARGDIGGVFAWGGGIGREHYYPGSGSFIFSPSNPTLNVDFYLYGQGNACIYKQDNVYRWGDYLTVRVDYPYGNVFRGTGFAFNGTCGKGGSGIDHTFVFGRKADMG